MIKTFRFNILSDANWETKVGEASVYFSGIIRHFELNSYGDDLDGIVIVLICCSPELHFKQRKRYSKKDKFFYLDIMLDYNEMMKTSDHFVKAKLITAKILEELFKNLETYRFKNLDLPRLKNDFFSFLNTKKLI